MRKILKWIIVGFLGLVVAILVGLLLNNRIVAIKHTMAQTEGQSLSIKELEAIEEIYAYLSAQGEEILPGLNGEDIDLIIYNDDYEFLITGNEEEDHWEHLGANNRLNKNVFRRNATNPQAFAVYVNERWVGSMSTINAYHKSLISQVGYLFPPQLLMLDDSHYKGVVIHEMVHALQGNNNDVRVRESSLLHKVCSNYYDNKRFNELIVEEASYLEQAINAADKESTIKYAKRFIEVRNNRRTECNMSQAEIQSEIDFEWLEGLARYAEYKASPGSKSPVRSNMDNIKDKAKYSNDDRYYTLGMAEALLLDKLQEDWKEEVFDEKFSFEERIEEIVKGL